MAIKEVKYDSQEYQLIKREQFIYDSISKIKDQFNLLPANEIIVESSSIFYVHPYAD